MPTDVFDLYGKVKLDTKEYVKALGDADKSFDSFGSKIKDGLAAITKVSAAAVGAAGAAVGKIVKDSVQAYGEYEQLVGGAKKIFDEIDYSVIATDAANAFKDLNMSASEYLESINLAGATFAQSMGDQKGYETARRGMLAISDFASGTGKNISELNQKYQMITRSASSYQSIADQFAGVLPQTTDDFLKQSQAAGLLSTEYTKLTEVPVAEYQQAVTKMLEKGVADLGLSQNTVRESTETLTGSIGMTKAAWDNFIVGLSDPDADLGLLIDTMFDSAAATFENILPTVERAVDGVTNVIPKVAPKISQSIKNIVPKILPELLESGATLVGSLGVGILSSLPDLADAGISIMGQIRDTLNSSSFDSSGMLSNIVNDMVDRIPQVFAIGEDILAAIANSIASLDYGKLGENISKIAVSGLNSMSELIADIDWDQVGKDIADFISGIDWNGIFEAGMDALGAAIKAAPDLIEGLLDNVDFMALSATAALKFTPKLISSLGDKLKDSDFGEVENALGDKFHTAGNDSGLSFFGKFSAVVEAAIIGWNIGSVIYKAFEPEIDKAVGDIANHFSKAFGGDATIYEDTDLINNWDEAFQNDAHLPTEIPELDTFQPSSLPGVAEKLAQQQVLAAVANMQPTIAETAKGKISKLRNSFKLRAGGGVVRSPEFSLVGEAGTEAIIPLKNDTDGIQQIADRLSKNMGGGMNVYQTFTVNANISSENDLKDLAGKLVKYVDEGLRAAQVDSNRAFGGVSW